MPRETTTHSFLRPDGKVLRVTTHTGEGVTRVELNEEPPVREASLEPEEQS